MATKVSAVESVMELSEGSGGIDVDPAGVGFSAGIVAKPSYGLRMRESTLHSMKVDVGS